MMLKKAISAVLALTMCLGLTVPVFAAETTAVPISAVEADAFDSTYLFECDLPENVQIHTTENFTANGVEMIDTGLYRIPAGTKLTITALADGVALFDVRIVDGKEVEYPLVANDTFTTGKYDGMKKSEKFEFALSNMSEVQTIRVASIPLAIEEDHYFQASSPSQTASNVTYANGYIVTEKDTLGLLALNNYGKYSYWDELYAANKDILKKTKNGQIYKGLEIVLPDVIGKDIKRFAPQFLAENEIFYTIKSGDTLAKISALAYNKDAANAKAIFERNSNRLASANELYAGQIIVLPVIEK